MGVTNKLPQTFYGGAEHSLSTQDSQGFVQQSRQLLLFMLLFDPLAVVGSQGGCRRGGHVLRARTVISMPTHGKQRPSDCDGIAKDELAII